MAEKCPCCNRTIRVRKPKQETPDEAQRRIRREAKARVNAAMRKPMPKKTLYREG